MRSFQMFHKFVFPLYFWFDPNSQLSPRNSSRISFTNSKSKQTYKNYLFDQYLTAAVSRCLFPVPSVISTECLSVRLSVSQSSQSAVHCMSVSQSVSKTVNHTPASQSVRQSITLQPVSQSVKQSIIF